MKKTFLVLIAGLAFLLLRFIQAQGDFAEQQALFPQSAAGVWRAWVAEEPEVLFNHREGRHDTGRRDGFYESYVKEVRAICILISRDGKPVSPVKIRCTLRLNPDDPAPALLSYGEMVEMSGTLLKPPSAMNPGRFVAILPCPINCKKT